ncbi:TIGR02678 family protein [Streptomyces sp. NPDC005731]|uniref:TIGR02678 family protein n=1 Tax=Streptomyces sp. NPDC005731 TaxID=3157056 RepID=UPI0033F15CDA
MSLRPAGPFAGQVTRRIGRRSPDFAACRAMAAQWAPGHSMPFTPRTYAYLALALSVLVTAPEQLLLSQLVADITAAVVDAGIEISDMGRQAERRTIAAALRQLVDWGAVVETEGHVAAVAEDQGGEALLSVDREIARAIVAGPLTLSRDGADLVRRAADPGFGGPRTYVRRCLVETPVVCLDDLTDTEREWLRSRQRREAQAFSELLGLEAEIRGEGIALVDADDELTDVRLPGTGTIVQAALRLVERLVDRLRPADPGHPSTGGRLVIGVPIPDAMLPKLIEELIEEYGRRSNWQRGLLEDPDALLAAVLDLLARMRLIAASGPVRADGHGLPDNYDDGAPHGRSVTDVFGARGQDRPSPRDGWVLLAAAARAPTVATTPASVPADSADHVTLTAPSTTAVATSAGSTTASPPPTSSARPPKRSPSPPPNAAW